jgi:ribosomal protein S18 acetylase RimI-like enzyme
MLSELSITEESPAKYDEYGCVSIAFRVTSRLRPGADGTSGLVEEPVMKAYVKDYEGPEQWAKRWDISRWCVFAAHQGAQRIGGAVVVWRAPDVDMLEGRDDLAILWDIRIDPEFRGRGIGSRLFAAAAQWANMRQCRELKIETQDVNVAACRLYASMGARLREVREGAYWDAPDELQMLWYAQL